MRRIEHPRLTGLSGKPRLAMLARLRRARNIAKGLTSEGKPRQRQQWSFGKHLGRTERHRLQVRSYYRQNYQAGLTARGTPRKLIRQSFPMNHFGYAAPMSQHELAWRELRATMNLVTPAESILERYEQEAISQTLR